MAKKRANGEGNRHKRKDGRWEGRYTAGHDPETGKAIYKNVLAKTQKECKEKLAVALEQAGKVDAHKTDQFTVGQWAEIWFENYAKPSIRETTAAYYKNYIDKHIVPKSEKSSSTSSPHWISRNFTTRQRLKVGSNATRV